MKKHLRLLTLLSGLMLVFPSGDILAMNPSTYMQVKLEKTSFHYPEPVTILVYLYGPNPIISARISATLVSPSGKKNTVFFSEDAVVGNMIPKSGGYAGVLTELTEDGTYHIHIHADDNRRKAHFTVGFIQDLPNPAPTDQPPGITPTLPFAINEETAIQVSGYAGRGRPAPLKISTLYAEVDRNQCVHLSWIVPLNIAPDAHYEIRSSNQNITSAKTWTEAKIVMQKKYTNKGGEMQKQKICNPAKGASCFAVKSASGQGLQSEISNSYRILIQ